MAFLFFFVDRWEGKGGQGKTQSGQGVSLRATQTPAASGSDPLIRQALLLCACPRLFAGKVGREEVGRESGQGTLKIGNITRKCARKGARHHVRQCVRNHEQIV